MWIQGKDLKKFVKVLRIRNENIHSLFSSLLEKVQNLLKLHDELKKEESEFKEHCRKDLADLQQKIE